MCKKCVKKSYVKEIKIFKTIIKKASMAEEGTIEWWEEVSRGGMGMRPKWLRMANYPLSPYRSFFMQKSIQ